MRLFITLFLVFGSLADLEVMDDDDDFGFATEDAYVEPVGDDVVLEDQGIVEGKLIDLNDGKKTLACSACEIVVKKVVANAKSILKKDPTVEALDGLLAKCTYSGWARTGDEGHEKYIDWQKAMSGGSLSLSGGLSMSGDVQDSLTNSCKYIAEQYKSVFWNTFVSKKRKVSALSGFKLSKEFCIAKEQVCPDKQKLKLKTKKRKHRRGEL